MPAQYNFDENDNNIHTRYSDLVRCTKKGVLDVVREMLFNKQRWSGGLADFGSTRHEMFCNESLQTGKTPECFKEVGVYEDVSMCEEQMECCIFTGVILHSTMDAYAHNKGIIIDYKTASIDPARANDEEYVKKVYHEHELQYKRSRQHLCYALQLLMKGIVPKGAMYLLEYWNGDRADPNADIKLFGYQKVMVDFTLADIVEFKNNWLKDRCERLVVAKEMFEHDAQQIENM